MTEEQLKNVFDSLIKENIKRIKTLSESKELKRFMGNFFSDVKNACVDLGVPFEDCFLDELRYNTKTNELSFFIEYDKDKVSNRSGILLPDENMKLHKGLLVDKRELNGKR